MLSSTAQNLLAEPKTISNALLFIRHADVTEKQRQIIVESYGKSNTIRTVPMIVLIGITAIGVAMIFLSNTQELHVETAGFIIATGGLILQFLYTLSAAILLLRSPWSKYYRWYKKAKDETGLREALPN